MSRLVVHAVLLAAALASGPVVDEQDAGKHIQPLAPFPQLEDITLNRKSSRSKNTISSPIYTGTRKALLYGPLALSVPDNPTLVYTEALSTSSGFLFISGTKECYIIVHMTYTTKKFDLPVLKGISEKQVKVHLALYEGYVKHVNLIMSTIVAYEKTDDEGGKYAIAEMRRRLAFEFDGMRMHEYYFEQFEGEKGGSPESGLATAAAEKYGSGEDFIKHIKEVAGSRGIGWVVVYRDPIGKTLHTVFVNDHELGQLAGLPILLALDLWEHAYMVDYVPAEKKNYIDAFFANLNWSIVEKRFDEAK